jgi:tetratricopeptide (TPR) repeat protein
MRRFTFALVLISFLALAAAGTAAFAYNSARKSKNAAQLSETNALKEKENARTAQKEAEKLADKLQKSTYELQKSTDDLETNRAALQKKVDDFKVSEQQRLEQTKLAEERAVAARAAEKKFLQRQAEAFAARRQAEEARKLAESNAERARLIGDGLEKRQSHDYDLARMAFQSLIVSLEETLKDPANQLKKDDAEELKVNLGWAHSNLGSVWLAIEDSASARESYEQARAILDRVWPKDGSADREPQDILFQTYNGLGHAYHEIGLQGYDVLNGSKQKIDPATYFKNAEVLFLAALKHYQAEFADAQMQLKAVAERGVAEGHTNLAHLYRDMGTLDRVEQNLKALVELDQAGRDEQIAALRGLAEFYRSQNKAEEILPTYDKLINEQEEFDEFEEGYAKFGQEIANSYSELADVYRTLADDYRSTAPAKVSASAKKANEAFEMSTAMQRFSTRLRLWLTAPNLGSNDRDDLADNVADAYVKLGKSDRALALYKYALNIRANGGDDDRASLGKSYDKLAKFYRLQKDYKQAAETYEKLIAFYRDNPRRGDYVATMLQIGSLYAEDPNAAPDAAVSIYEEAGAIAVQRNDWETENIVHYRLTKLYENRNQTQERGKALLRRVEGLSKYVDQVKAGKPITPNKPITLVYEYLQAVNALAYFHSGKNDPEAANAYRRAYDVRDYITNNLSVEKDKTILKFYAAVLGDYQVLLNRLNSRPLAAEVGKVAQGFRDKLIKVEERNLTRDGGPAAAP